MGIQPAQTEIEFLQDDMGRWYIVKSSNAQKSSSRFRTAHKMGKLMMTTDQVMALTRGETWPSSWWIG